MDKTKYTPYSRKYDLIQLIEDYNKYGQIIVAYDFDETVHADSPHLQEICNLVRELLRKCSRYTYDIDMICYTCRGDETLETEVIPYLDSMGIRHDKINENSDHISEDIRRTLSNKLMFTIFLDNRCGLVHSYYVLSDFLAWLKVQKHEIPDIFGFDQL